MMLYYILFHFDVSLQTSLIKNSIFLERDWNNLSLHGIVMFWTVVPFYFFFVTLILRVSPVLALALVSAGSDIAATDLAPFAGCQVREKTRECGAHLSSVFTAFHKPGA